MCQRDGVTPTKEQSRQEIAHSGRLRTPTNSDVQPLDFAWTRWGIEHASSSNRFHQTTGRFGVIDIDLKAVISPCVTYGAISVDLSESGLCCFVIRRGQRWLGQERNRTSRACSG